MPDPISGAGRRIPNLALTELQGKELPKGGELVAETKSSTITLSSEIRPGVYVPDLKIANREVVDPEIKESIISNEDVSGIATGEDFKAKLNELFEANKGFLIPNKTELADKLNGDDSYYAYNNISGSRIEKFFEEAHGLIEKSGLSGDDAKAARKAVNIAHADAYRGRSINFDRAETDSYWSYKNDAPFVHVYEKMLDSLPEDHPARDGIQNQLDFTFSKKYAPKGKVDENDIENTLELTAVDKESRAVVSMVKDSMDSVTPTYETIKVPAGADSDLAGKSVYWDHNSDKYFVEGGSQEVPAELVETLERTPADTVVFRRAKDGEKARDGFRFDWNGNRMMDQDKIDVGWWGHCDIKAIMEAVHADMDGSKGVTEYRSDTGTTTKYSRDDLLEIMASQLNMGGQYQEYGTGKQVYLGDNRFGGARYDKRPDKLFMQVNGRYQDFNIHIKNLSKVGNADENVDVSDSFSKFKADDARESFEANEDLMQTIQGDTNIISGNDRKIEAQVEYYTVNESGAWVEKKDDVTIAPDAEGKVLVGTDILNIANREMRRYYFDPKTNELSSANVTFERNAEGQYEAKEGDSQVVGRSHNLLLGREMKAGDEVESKVELVDLAKKTGTQLSADSDTDQEVWNGATYRIHEEVEWRSEDGRFERIALRTDSVYGSGKSGTKINELDDEGKVIRTHEMSSPVDFFWRNTPRVAPIVLEDGKWHVNSAMTERGLLDLNNLDTSLESFRNLNDLMFLGLNTKDKSKVYTIVHDGKRLVYDTEEAWKADVERLENLANPTPTPGPQVD
jgi:hypothetical protein